jgi:hypothetical protein
MNLAFKPAAGPKVKKGYDIASNQYTTDVIVADRTSPAEHLHIVFSESGEILHEQWTPNH